MFGSYLQRAIPGQQTSVTSVNGRRWSCRLHYIFQPQERGLYRIRVQLARQSYLLSTITYCTYFVAAREFATTSRVLSIQAFYRGHNTLYTSIKLFCFMCFFDMFCIKPASINNLMWWLGKCASWTFVLLIIKNSIIIINSTSICGMQCMKLAHRNFPSCLHLFRLGACMCIVIPIMHETHQSKSLCNQNHRCAWSMIMVIPMTNQQKLF